MLSEDERDLLQNVQEDPPPKTFPRSILIILGLVLAGIMTSYIFLIPTVQDNLVGFLQSSVILENTIERGETTIHVSESVKEQVQSYYTSFPDVETALCLKGQHSNNTYNITSVHRPEVYSSSFTHVSHAPCPNETVIMFHTHPENSCRASAQDRRTLQNAQQGTPHMAMLIMCQPQRFNIIT